MGLGALLFAGALLLSDRAPGVLKAMFGDRARQLWARIDEGGRTEAVTGGARPEADFLIHVAIWAVVACLAGLAIWSWFGLVATAMTVFGASVATELAQGVWSSTRQVERADVAANAVGVTGGVVAAGLIYLLWAGVAAVFARPA